MSYRLLVGLALIVLAILLGFGLTYSNAHELHAHERQQLADLKQFRQSALHQHEARDQWLLLTICRNQNIVQKRLHLMPTDCSDLILKPVR